MAEAELCAVSEERDGLLPQLEEARWRNRQAEKDLAQLKDTAAALQQVRARPRVPILRCKFCTLFGRHGKPGDSDASPCSASVVLGPCFGRRLEPWPAWEKRPPACLRVGNSNPDDLMQRRSSTDR